MIPQCNPHANYAGNRAEINAAIQRVLDSKNYILGEEVTEFEKEFAAFTGTAYAVSVANGTDALALALRAAGIRRGDWVATASLTASATGAAIDMAGARPVFIDISPTTYTLDPARLVETLTADHDRRIKAVVPVHLYGAPAEMKAILQIAEQFGVLVIEDAAQAHGAKWSQAKVGSGGLAGAFSFYPTKNLGAIGDGGCVTTNSESFADELRVLRQYGWKHRYDSRTKGVNSRLDELQAAILRVKLLKLDGDNAKRAAIAAKYIAGLGNAGFQLPIEHEGAESVWHQFVIRRPDRDKCRQFLAEHGVSTLVHYPVPLHLQGAWSDCSECGVGGLEHTEHACGEILSLPIYPELDADDVERVIELLVEYRLP